MRQRSKSELWVGREVVFLIPNFDDSFIKMLLISKCGVATNLISINLSAPSPPFSDDFLGDLNAPIQDHFRDTSTAKKEGVVQPNVV